MIVIILFAALLVIIIIAINRKPNKKPPEKYFKYSDDIIRSDNKRKARIERGEHDEMYYAWKDYHKGKSLEQIEQYVKEKREEIWSYWQDNRLEYKVLMELSRELELIRNKEIKQLIESDGVFQLTYSKLIEYYRMITYNPQIYKGFNLSLLEEALNIASFNKFHSQLITKTPSTAVKWLNARENEGEYISDELKEMAKELEKQETPKEVYKRTRKNIQSNISKAKKEGDWIKTEELEQKLINLEKPKES